MSDFLKHFLSEFFGDKPLYVYAACMVFALIGAYIITVIKTRSRKVTSEKSPFKFNIYYMITDNAPDVIFAMTLSFVIFRFSNSWSQDPADLYLYAIALGALFNTVVIAVKIVFRNISKKITDYANRLKKL